jgi:hypothetical protein
MQQPRVPLRRLSFTGPLGEVTLCENGKYAAVVLQDEIIPCKVEANNENRWPRSPVARAAHEVVVLQYTHTAVMHPLASGRIYSAAGDGYFESTETGDSWRSPEDRTDRRERDQAPYSYHFPPF